MGVCLFVRLFDCLFVCLFVYLFVCLFVCFSTTSNVCDCNLNDFSKRLHGHSAARIFVACFQQALLEVHFQS